MNFMEELFQVPDEPAEFDAVLVPLRDMVVFPRTSAPLFMEEELLDAVQDLAEEGLAVVAVAQRDEEIDDPTPDDLFQTGTLIDPLHILRLPEGGISVMVRGLWRVHIKGFLPEQNGLMIAHVESIAEPAVEDTWNCKTACTTKCRKRWTRPSVNTSCANNCASSSANWANATPSLAKPKNCASASWKAPCPRRCAKRRSKSSDASKPCPPWYPKWASFAPTSIGCSTCHGANRHPKKSTSKKPPRYSTKITTPCKKPKSAFSNTWRCASWRATKCPARFSVWRGQPCLHA